MSPITSASSQTWVPSLVDSRPVRGALERFYRRAWVIDVRYRQDKSKKSATLDGR